MKAIILDLTNGSELNANHLSTSVSFHPLFQYIQKAAKTESPIKRLYLEKALESISAEPGFLQIHTIEQTLQYVEQLRIVYDLLTPVFESGAGSVWALGIPLSPIIFYGTDRFYQMAMDPLTLDRRNDLITDTVEFSEKDRILNVYVLIFERVYKITTPDHKPLVITVKDDISQTAKYFRINIDHRFTEVSARHDLPKIDVRQITELLTGNGDLQQLLTLVPLNDFHFEGVSIITLNDITAEHTLEKLKSVVLEKEEVARDIFYRRICETLRILLADPVVEFGFIPQLKVNSKAILDEKNIFQSTDDLKIFLDVERAEMYDLFARHFIDTHASVILKDIADVDFGKFWKIMDDAGISAYGLLPVYNGLNLVGMLELYSLSKDGFQQDQLSRIYPANNLLCKIFQDLIDAFDQRIKTVISEKFTSIQPAVEWKFQQAAWQYIKDKDSKISGQSGEIIFESIYPLYGAIDIRNSTAVRNVALKQDMQLQLEMLITLLMVLDLKLSLFSASQLAFKCNKMIMKLIDGQGDADESRISEFIRNEAHPYLIRFISENDDENLDQSPKIARKKTQDVRLLVLEYFNEITQENGTTYANRRQVEESIKMINSCINRQLDDFKGQMQTLYPVYFEKFRTDGVEFDIYIGQSINPEKKFRQIHLKKVKQWQLNTMVDIARKANALLPAMKKHLATTQLIFVNSNAIDITFRDDERRFDVEGAFNIRYQVIKKRIDKVHTKSTGERLTQPGKIAVVYIQSKAIRDYLDHINFLQAQNVLADDLEFLELEELQGVSGLKALRVGIMLDQPR